MEQNKYKILLVEDDQTLVKMYVIKLEREGFIVDVAYNGIDGLEKLEKNIYDTMLLDLMMPQMDGFEMIKTFNGSKFYRKFPILILSNLGQQEDIDKAVSLGIGKDDYIVKANMTPSEVIERIRKSIENFKK